MSVLGKSRFFVSSVGVACLSASCFLVACGDDDDGGTGSEAGSGATAGKAGGSTNGGSAGKAGGATAGEENGGSAGETEPQGGSAGEGEAGAGGEAGESVGGTGGTAGLGGTGGVAGGTAGVGGTSGGAGGVGGTAGAGGSGGAPVVGVPNCVRNTTAGQKVEISTTGHDGLFGAAYGPDGFLYATGYVQDGVSATADRSTVVVRLLATGALDTSWATGGIAKVNVVATATGVNGAAELPRGIVFQGTKIVVAGTVEASATATDVTAGDRNVYVLRLNANGTVDTTFGDSASGIKILSFNTGIATTNAQGQPAWTGADAQWGLNVDPDGTLLVTAAQRSELVPTTRTDTDFAIMKLSVDGQPVLAFGPNGNGKFTLDIASASASVRTASVLPDKKILVTGYSTYGGTQRPVIFKLTEGGLLDMSFGLFGVFSESVGTAAEAYGAVLQSDGKLVTVGYGRPYGSATGATTDLLSIRLTATGLLDTTYGSAAGRTWFDVGGYADNGRSMVVIGGGDNRPVLFGGGRTISDDQDAVVVLLAADGKPATTFGSPFGCQSYDFGTKGDFFWGSAIKADNSVIAGVGLTGADTATADTDSIVLVFNKP